MDNLGQCGGNWMIHIDKIGHYGQNEKLRTKGKEKCKKVASKDWTKKKRKVGRKIDKIGQYGQNTRSNHKMLLFCT